MEQVTRLRERTKLLPEFRNLQRVSLVHDLAEASWYVWKYDYRLLLSADVPAPAGPIVFGQPHNKGDVLLSRSSSEIKAPSDGWLALDQSESTVQWASHTPSCALFQNPAAPELGDFQALSVTGPCIFGPNGSWTDNVAFHAASLHPPVRVDGPPDPNIPELQWPPYSIWFGSSDDPEDLRARILAELDQYPEDYDILIPWLDHYFGGPSPNPITAAVPVPDCSGSTPAQCKRALTGAGLTHTDVVELEDWATQASLPANGIVSVEGQGSSLDPGETVSIAVNPDPKPNPIPDPPPSARDDDSEICDLDGGGNFAVPPDSASTIFAPMFGSDPTDNNSPANMPIAGGGSAAMLSGWTSFSSGVTGWGGFDYDHIYAKHGWSVADEIETRATLADPLSDPTIEETPVGEPDRVGYTASTTSEHVRWRRRNGQDVLCKRHVVVQPSRINSSDGNGGSKVFELQPSAQVQTGIWTSFGMEILKR